MRFVGKASVGSVSSPTPTGIFSALAGVSAGTAETAVKVSFSLCCFVVRAGILAGSKSCGRAQCRSQTP